MKTNCKEINLQCQRIFQNNSLCRFVNSLEVDMINEPGANFPQGVEIHLHKAITL